MKTHMPVLSLLSVLCAAQDLLPREWSSIDIIKTDLDSYVQRPISRVILDTQFAISINTQHFHVFMGCFVVLLYVLSLCNALTFFL